MGVPDIMCETIGALLIVGFLIWALAQAGRSMTPATPPAPPPPSPPPPPPPPSAPAPSRRRAAGARRGAEWWIDRASVASGDFTRKRDPISGARFSPGETVWTHSCEAVYKPESYQLLLAENAGRCGCCADPGTWTRATVPAARAPASPPPPPPAPAPAPAPRRTPRPPPSWPTTSDGALLVGVADARRHFGRVVQLVAPVLEVRRAAKGTVALLFETGTYTAALKAVIFGRDVARFRGVGLARMEGRTVTVRGLLQRHPIFGPQVILSDPACISCQAGGGDGVR